MRLRRLSILALGLFVSTSLRPAVAADVETSSYDWTGFYAGGHVGYGSIDLKGRNSGLGDGSFDLEDDDILGGFQAGFNYQIDNIVLGIEGDVSFVSFNDKLARNDEEVSFDTDILATLRARAGLAFDDVLWFATAGIAWTDTRFEVDEGASGAPDPSGGIDLDDVGFVAGGGAEYALDENWSVKAEALYMIFDDKEKTEDLTSNAEIGDFIELDDVFVVRVGVNFHL